MYIVLKMKELKSFEYEAEKLGSIACMITNRKTHKSTGTPKIHIYSYLVLGTM